MTVPVHDLPPLLREGHLVALVPPELRLDRWQRVACVTDDGGPGQLVAFEGVRGISDAQALVGKTILARDEDLPADVGLRDAAGLIGRTVADEDHGTLGTIEEVMVGVAQNVWVIRGAYGEVLLPAVDEFVIRVAEEGPIEVRLPEGTLV